MCCVCSVAVVHRHKWGVKIADVMLPVWSDSVRIGVEVKNLITR